MQTKQETETDKKVERAPTRLNSAHSKWASPISGKLSDEALRLEQEKQEKSNRLEQRRSHLSAVLEAEKNQFQNEITSIRQSSRESIPDMKIRGDSLRSTYQKERQTIADEKLDDHRITNNLNLCSIEQQKLENLQPEYWSEQLNEKLLIQREEEEETDIKYQEEFRQRLDEYDRQEQEKQIERENRIVQLKIILQQQMNEIKRQEEESELLKQEEEHLLREQSQLDQYEEEIKQMEKRYIQQDHGRQLLRQHKAKLHKRAKEIQEQLELDIKILAFIAHADDESRLEQSEQRKQSKRNTINMLKQFEQQMKLEKEKEKELDIMFQEEAAKQWSHREQEWNSEKESRKKLMRQVMDQRQEEIMEKLQALKQRQEEIYQRQQTLIDDMEQARKYNLIEKQKQAKEKEDKKQDLQKQILIVKQERAQSQLDLEKQDAIERDNNKQIDQLAQKEKAVITATIVEPKFYGRRRINWN